MNENHQDLIWHYTSIHGLYGIIHNQKIHCTNAFFLNDLKEHRIIRDLFLDNIQNYINECSDPVVKEMLYKCVIGFESAFSSASPHLIPYVASFSKKDDLLSQWMGYAQGQGYSLGFSREELAKQTFETKFNLDDIEYVKDGIIPESLKPEFERFRKQIDGIVSDNESFIKRQDEFANHILRSRNMPYDRSNHWMMMHQTVQVRLTTTALGISAKYKSAAFCEEDEVRLHATNISKDSNLQDIRELKCAGNILKPYTAFPIDLKSTLKVIRIGPTLQKEEAKLAIEIFLDVHNLKNVEIVYSSIPYRTWDS